MTQTPKDVSADSSGLGPGVSVSVVRSAGGIAFCKQGHDFRIAMLQSYAGNWVLPKGTVEQGETEIEAAVREIYEETGLLTTVTVSLGQLSYSFRSSGNQHDKIVSHYLARVIDGFLVHNPEEHAGGAWINIEQAINAARFPNESAMIAKAQKLLLEADIFPGDDLERAGLTTPKIQCLR